jgi:hypothetical protein
MMTFMQSLLLAAQPSELEALEQARCSSHAHRPMCARAGASLRAYTRARAHRMEPPSPRAE